LAAPVLVIKKAIHNCDQMHLPNPKRQIVSSQDVLGITAKTCRKGVWNWGLRMALCCQS
jgi:hypothetical protein